MIFDILGRLYTLTILFNYFMLRKPGADVNTANANPTIVAQPTSMPRTLLIPEITELTSIYDEASSLSVRRMENSQNTRALGGSVGASR
ncbi:hypothetical protein BDP27DRAFT_235729 [Rhodocollybia butyracea]|uniref:Uncharacterized protein n=1 Tax=Rhodocollybia butyracea TaxID=206335 RepID=A0A9P5PE14_9AGAR|nr:hypothetical protein BDP27DRAFT_235729 [Rhodocollybia butyracea]